MPKGGTLKGALVQMILYAILEAWPSRIGAIPAAQRVLTYSSFNVGYTHE